MSFIISNENFWRPIGYLLTNFNTAKCFFFILSNQPITLMASRLVRFITFTLVILYVLDFSSSLILVWCELLLLFLPKLFSEKEKWLSSTANKIKEQKQTMKLFNMQHKNYYLNCSYSDFCKTKHENNKKDKTNQKYEFTFTNTWVKNKPNNKQIFAYWLNKTFFQC